MKRLRVDRLTVTSSMNYFAVSGCNDCISITKNILALLVSLSLLTTPVWAAPSSSPLTAMTLEDLYVSSPDDAARALVDQASPAASPVDHEPPPRLADGVELIGEFADSGFKQPPFIVRRSDGQVVRESTPRPRTRP